MCFEVTFNVDSSVFAFAEIYQLLKHQNASFANSNYCRSPSRNDSERWFSLRIFVMCVVYSLVTEIAAPSVSPWSSKLLASVWHLFQNRRTETSDTLASHGKGKMAFISLGEWQSEEEDSEDEWVDIDHSVEEEAEVRLVVDPVIVVNLRSRNQSGLWEAVCRGSGQDSGHRIRNPGFDFRPDRSLDLFTVYSSILKSEWKM